MSDSLRSHGACQTPLFMEFSRQEYWSRLPFSFPWDPPNPGIEPGLLHCRQILYCWVTREVPIALGWAYWQRTFNPPTDLLLEIFLCLVATTLNSSYILEFLCPNLSQGHSLCSTSAATVLFRNPSTLHRWILWTVTWCLNPFPYSFWSIFYIANSIIFIKLKHTHNSPWDFLGKNPGVSRHLVLQGIFLTLGSNPVSHSRQILHRLSHQGCLIHFI